MVPRRRRQRHKDYRNGGASSWAQYTTSRAVTRLQYGSQYAPGMSLLRSRETRTKKAVWHLLGNAREAIGVHGLRNIGIGLVVPKVRPSTPYVVVNHSSSGPSIDPAQLAILHRASTPSGAVLCEIKS